MEISLIIMIVSGFVKVLPDIVKLFKGVDPNDPNAAQIIEEWFRKSVDITKPPAWDDIKPYDSGKMHE